jgi:hypothetical protein
VRLPRIMTKTKARMRKNRLRRGGLPRHSMDSGIVLRSFHQRFRL